MDHKTWEGRNTFLCKARCVTGPINQIGPSIVVHTILMTVLFIWAGVAIPSLHYGDNFPQASIGAMVVDYVILVIIVLTFVLALKT